jgi:hypothetical protein
MDLFELRGDPRGGSGVYTVSMLCSSLGPSLSLKRAIEATSEQLT